MAGLQLTTSADADMQPGDLFFGKSDDNGLLLGWHQREKEWTGIPLASQPARPVLVSDFDRFEVTSQGGRYEFKLNGVVIATWSRPLPRAEWARFWAGEGNRAEFLDWRVVRPE